jgi:hypothetical protein
MVLLGSVSSAYTIPMSVLENQEDITLTMIVNRLLEENRKLHEKGARRLEKLEIAMLINYHGKLGTWSHKAGHRSQGKLDFNTVKGSLIGYVGMNQYRIWLEGRKDIIVIQDVVFNENP